MPLSDTEIIDTLADRYYNLTDECGGAAGLARARLAAEVAQYLYYATGREFRVTQVIPEPTHPTRVRGHR